MKLNDGADKGNVRLRRAVVFAAVIVGVLCGGKLVGYGQNTDKGTKITDTKEGTKLIDIKDPGNGTKRNPAISGISTNAADDAAGLIRRRRTNAFSWAQGTNDFPMIEYGGLIIKRTPQDKQWDTDEGGGLINWTNHLKKNTNSPIRLPKTEVVKDGGAIK